MIDHVSLGTTRYADAVAFYTRALAPLGFELLRDTGREAGFGTSDRWCFWLYPVDDATPVTAPRMHVALGAASRAQVDGVHAAAISASGRDITSPRPRPDIDDTYYGAMFHDLDGHRIEVLTRAG